MSWYELSKAWKFFNMGILFDYMNCYRVFVDEACDDLGGEFCEPDFQKGT